MADVWYMSQGDTPEMTGTLEREVDENVWVAENLTGSTVTLTLYRSNGSVYKADTAVTITDVTGGGVKYVGVTADSQQGGLTGKFRVTYADGSKRSFPNTGHFQIRVSR